MRISLRMIHSIYIFSRKTAFNDLVKLTTIQPNPPTAWAIINFNTLAFRHQKRSISTARTFHFISRFLRWSPNGTFKFTLSKKAQKVIPYWATTSLL